MTALLSFLRALTVALAASDLAVSAVAVEKSKWSFLRTAARNAFADAHAFDKQATRVREEIEKHLCTKQGDAALMGGSYTPGALTAADQRRRSYLKQNSLAIFKNVRAKVFPGASADAKPTSTTPSPSKASKAKSAVKKVVKPKSAGQAPAPAKPDAAAVQAVQQPQGAPAAAAAAAGDALEGALSEQEQAFREHAAAVRGLGDTYEQMESALLAGRSEAASQLLQASFQAAALRAETWKGRAGGPRKRPRSEDDSEEEEEVEKQALDVHGAITITIAKRLGETMTIDLAERIAKLSRVNSGTIKSSDMLCVVNKGPVTITIDDIATVLKQRDSIVVNNGEVHDLKPGAQYMSVTYFTLQ